jgi:hypothetical protein
LSRPITYEVGFVIFSMRPFVKGNLSKEVFSIRANSNLTKSGMASTLPRTVIAGVSKHKITVISDLAGCPQTFLASECVVYAQKGVAVQPCASSAAGPATLLPRDAILLAFVVDTQGNTFLFHDDLFAARAEYSLHEYVGNDSIVYGFAFLDTMLRVPVVRLFDACRLRGQCLLSLTCFQRFGRLFDGLNATTRSRSSLVRLHWVWTEGWVDEFVLRKPGEALHGMDCEWECAIRLPEILAPDALYHVIEPAD